MAGRYRDYAVALVRSAAIGGTEATLEIWPEMQHLFQPGIGRIPMRGRR